MTKESYEEKVAREERLHQKHLENVEHKKRMAWWMNLSNEQAQNEIQKMESLNNAFRGKQ